MNESLVVREPLPWSGLIKVHLLVGVIATFYCSLYSIWDSENFFALALLAFSASPVTAGLACLIALICLLPADLSLRCFILTLSLLWFFLAIASGVVMGDWFLRAQSDPWSVVMHNGVFTASFFTLSTLPTLVFMLPLRSFKRWRCVGPSDYWRRPGLSILGMLGLMVIVAIVLAVYLRVDLSGLPLEPIYMIGAYSLGFGLCTALLIPLLLRMGLRGEPRLLLPLLFLIVVEWLVMVAGSNFFLSSDWLGWVMLSGIAWFFGALPGAWAILWALRFVGWRLVRGRRLTMEERGLTKLPPAWETVDAWTRTVGTP